MKKHNLFASIIFGICLFLFVAASAYERNNTLQGGECHHCGSVTACESGGQSYGYFACQYFPGQQPPDNCRVMGSNNCGPAVPGEN